MTLLLPEEEYPMEPFQWCLPAVQIWCFWLLHDWRYIDFQTGHFADIEQFKINNYFADFKHVKTDPTYSFLLTLSKSKYFTEFRQDVRPRKSMQTFSVWQKIQEPGIYGGSYVQLKKINLVPKSFIFVTKKINLSVFLICGTK